jgi:D-3-phosphoglycerate dehydrogenase
MVEDGDAGGAGTGCVVFLTEPIHEDGLALLAEGGAEVLRGWEMDAAAKAAALARAGAAIVRMARVDAAFLGAAPGLGVVAKHGVGVDNIDLVAARARGVAVVNTPEANAVSVAEHALALLLALAKRLPAMDAAVRAGGWTKDVAQPVELAGLPVAVLGFGRSGRRFAALAAALGMEVRVWSRSVSGPVTPEGFAVAGTLAAALEGAAAVSVHLPLSDETRGLIGAEALARLAQGAFVVNVGRGGVVDEAALAAASHLGGVGMDVFEVEPPLPGNPLLGRADAILTPHAAGPTGAALRRMGIEAARGVLDWAEGRLEAGRRIV